MSNQRPFNGPSTTGKPSGGGEETTRLPLSLPHRRPNGNVKGKNYAWLPTAR